MLYLQKPKNFISMGVAPHTGIFHDMRLAKVSLRSSLLRYLNISYVNMKHNTQWLVLIICGLSLSVQGCGDPVQKAMDYCASQASLTLESVPSVDKIPNSVFKDSRQWNYTSPGNWTSGFWPGQLWYLFEGTGDAKWKEAASAVTEQIIPVAYRKARNHDMGFITMPSIGHAYRLTGNERYKEALVSAADSLICLYNPTVGTTMSWPNMVSRMNWPHNTIIDNMMNLELLFWVAENADRPDLYAIAHRHAEVTMKHQFREDYSTYHVMVFDPSDGHFISGHTHQGWKDESTWARGQAWAIYGFTMAYRFTKDERFLDTAVKAADFFLNNLPEDMVPFWDFDAGKELPEQPKDCSASAIAASALLEMQSYLPEDLSEYYMDKAIKMVEAMSNPPYRAGDQCSAFLLHCTGHMPKGGEVDASISYAEYYYIEAIIRLQRMLLGKEIV